MTRIVVLIPVYRNAAGLQRTLTSLREAVGCFDIVIVDDGSPEPVSAPPCLRDGISVTLLRLEKNCGIAVALNHGLRRILAYEYSYIARLDAGDTVDAERIELQVRFLDDEPECAAASSFIGFVDANQKLLFCYRAPCNNADILQKLRLNNCLIHSGTILRASALRALGPYREDTPGAEDYELFLRMSRRYKLAVLPRILTYCEYAADGLSIAGRQKQQKERLKLQLRYFDSKSVYSFLGIGRTLLSMLTPQSAVSGYKRAFVR